MSNDSKAIVPIRQGLVVAISRQLAITEKLLSQISAEQGHAEAQYKLGEMYRYEGDLAEAVKWYRMAAEKGHAGAQFMLGHIMYANGLGAPEDYAEPLCPELLGGAAAPPYRRREDFCPAPPCKTGADWP